MNHRQFLANCIRKVNKMQMPLQSSLSGAALKAKQIIKLQQRLSTLVEHPKPSRLHYNPTPYLTHPFFQVIYNLSEPRLPLEYNRERIYFEDGGHVSLDWALPQQFSDGKWQEVEPEEHTPIFFVMHGLTGGSEMNYIKALIDEARKNGFRSVCLNSRGICNEMTSPIPFTALEFHELQASLELIEKRYPHAPIYMVGTSFGANYLSRYLLRTNRPSVKGFVALATPFDIIDVVTSMKPIYQKFFVERYIKETVKKHKAMEYWFDTGLVNMNEVYSAKNLWQFHQAITVKIVNETDVRRLFHRYSIGSQISELKIPSLFMNSLDDPIVSASSIPSQLHNNPNIELIMTKSGGHVCWYEGIKPKRWYPKPTVNFFNKLLQCS